MTETLDQYTEKIRRKLHDIHEETARLAGKDSQKHPEKNLEYTQLMESLNIKRDQLEQKITEIHQAEEDARQGLKQELEMLWKALRSQYAEIRAKLEHDQAEKSILNQLPPRFKEK